MSTMPLLPLDDDLLVDYTATPMTIVYTGAAPGSPDEALALISRLSCVCARLALERARPCAVLAGGHVLVACNGEAMPMK